MITKVKTADEIAAMREGGKMLATVLGVLRDKVSVGMTSADLSAIAKAELDKLGGKPAFLGYGGFPDVLCVSINEEVVHGIPTKVRMIQEGDIVSLDFGVLHKNLITDAAISVIVGNVKDPRDIELVNATKKSLEVGLKTIKNGTPIGTIGSAVQGVLEKSRLGIVQEFVGHGVGHHLHEEPGIPNYGSRGEGFVLRSGMTVAVEPMATLGDPSVFIADDGWTVITSDRKRSAHFEHSVLVTDDGFEILTEL